MYQTQLPSPLGLLTLTADGEAITGLWIAGQKYYPVELKAETRPGLPVFQQAALWLDAYFHGAALPAMPLLAPKGSPFQHAVWQLLREIPYGTTETYGALAHQIQETGRSASAQAVGGAVGRNPISILIPCHRVIGRDGSLTGYASGVEKKQFLLKLEGVDTAH